MEIDTKGAHSFLTIPLSSDWKALMMKDRRWVLIVAESVASKVMESMRRNKLEKSTGLSANMSITVSARGAYFSGRTYPMLADVLEF